MTKYYCYQVDPEYQESPLDLVYPESVMDVTVFGNRNYREWFSSEIASIMKLLRNDAFLCDYFDCENNIDRRYVLHEWFGKLPEISDEELHELEDFFGMNNPDMYARIFSILTGKDYRFFEIKGSCQRQWNYLYWSHTDHPHFDWIDFEIQYFNEGSQWVVKEDDEDEYYYTVYCTHWKEFDIREEIAMQLGIEPADVKLFKFDGYKRTPKYKECVFD